MSMYEDRLCAFVDILGFRGLVEQSLERPQLAQQIRRILREVVLAKPVWERDNPVDVIEARLREQGVADPGAQAERRVREYAAAERGINFSDSLILSATLDARAISSLVSSLLFLSRRLAELGQYVRGGVCLGPLCHEEDLCFGPALIAAYDLERKVAIYPRIIFTPEAHDAIAGTEMNVVGPLESYLRKDCDGEQFLDFLNQQAMDLSGPFRAEQMNDVRRELSRQLSSSQAGHPIRPKLVWLARYFNSALDEAPTAGVQKLAIDG